MIDLGDIKGRNALIRLNLYEGRNPYLTKLKDEYKRKGKIVLSNTQEAYILDNYDRDPIKIDRVVSISEYIGKEFQEKYELKFTPERMYVGFVLAQTEKSYHVYGKLSQKQKENRIYWLPKTQVMEDLFYVPVNVEVNFDKYTKLDTMGRIPYQHQIDGVKFLLSRDGCILADDMGLGKAQSLDSLILTPDGWVTMGDIKIGDLVIGSNGMPTKVTGVFPQGFKPMYDITFTDGTIVESCDEHLWAVQTPVQKKRKSGFVVKPLKDIMVDLTQSKSKNVKWYIPMVQPVNFTKKSVLIDPYVLGCLLGDGSFTQHTTSISSADVELISEIKSRLPEGHVIKHRSNYDYGLVSEVCDPYSGNIINSITGGLRTLGLMGMKSENKFIPNSYKFNSLDVRLQILQGLLDTDGYVSESGTIQYYSVSERLKEDVKELVQSFGGVARESEKIGSYKTPDGETVNCKMCYILTINLPSGIVPFKLTRKLNRVNINKKYQPSRGIKSVKYSKNVEAQCISVEADDSLYVTNRYVVTHNTYQSIIAALESGAEKILIICPASVKINWKREIEMFGETDIAVIDGLKWKSAKWMIINYDILKKYHTITPKTKAQKDAIEHWDRDMMDENVGLIIADEGHKLKDHKSNRGTIAGELTRNPLTKRVWLLTGTPVANRPKDFYNLLKLIKSPLADNYPFYIKRYCDGKWLHRTVGSGNNKYVKKTLIANGHSNLDELALKSRNYVMRRLKTEVLDMPDKIVTPTHHELTKVQREEYEFLWEDYVEARKKAKKKGATPSRDLVEVILLRKFMAMAAIDKTIEMVEDAIDEGQKVLIFTTFKDEQEELAEYFGKKCVVHNGSMSEAEKQKSVDKFQKNKNTKVFIGNIISAGVGITLTEATVVVFNSFDWVPGNNEQAEDRCYRIGQEFTVNVYYQLFDDTITTKMWYTVQRKRDVIDQIIGNGSDKCIDEYVDYVIEE